MANLNASVSVSVEKGPFSRKDRVRTDDKKTELETGCEKITL